MSESKREVPVLTEIVKDAIAPRRAVDDQALEGVRAEIAVSVTQMVREAVAASVAFALRPKTPE